jgi:D-3-phosphoglycerate dehydrogenase
MSGRRVVITDYDFPDVAVERAILEGVGVEVLAYHCQGAEDVLKVVGDADVVINQYAPITRNVIMHLGKSCVALGQYGIGVDTIDVQAATEQGIVVINVPSYCEEEVAEHALALLLALARRLLRYDAEVRSGTWDWTTQAPIHRMAGRTLGLVGFGKIARKLAEKVQGLSLVIVSYDPLVPAAAMQEMGVRKVSLEELLRQSDFISIHVPLTEATRNLIAEPQFRLMKEDALLVNVSRGAVLDQDALYRALSERRILAAGLDVLTEEPPRAPHHGEALLSLDNTCLTPHVAWYSEESILLLRERLARDVAGILEGKKPNGFVNQSVKPRVALK